MRRRALLAVLGAAGLAGCSGPAGSSSAASPSSPAGTSPAAPGPGPSAGAAPPPWRQLGARLGGRLVLPADAGYDRARLGYDPRYDSVRPAAVAQVAGAADVAATLAFAAEHEVPFSVRSGGHAYPGWSTGTGLVLDVSRLAAVTVSGRTVTAGAGARLVDVYAAAARSGLAVPAGSCPSVGLAGLALGGGVGVLSRAWGLTCDAVQVLEIVTADGRPRSVDAHADPDLFWASRGGGGGSFGVATSFTLAARPAPALTLFYLRFGWSQAAEVVSAWQEWAPTADRRLWSTCKLLAHPAGEPRVEVSGTWVGGEAGLAPVLARFRTAAGAAPLASSLRTRGYLDAMLAEAGCLATGLAACHLPPAGSLARQPFAATSSMPAAAIPEAGVRALVAAVGGAAHPPGLVEAGVSLDALGGAVADVAPPATAFVHRGSPYSLQFTATWAHPRRPADPFDRLVRALRAAVVPWTGPGAYVNYADAALTDWANAYYGDNLGRLRAVKRAVDPHGLFTFPQAVPA